jgi:hypothetical protein
VGGPFRSLHGKDKLFFFVDYEGLRESALTQTATVPSALARGDFATAGPPSTIPTRVSMPPVN